jgi:hypothetical protein
MRVMIAVVIVMIASILSITMINTGEGQAANGGQLEASVNGPQTN